MPMTDEDLRARIRDVLLRQVDTDANRRQEALREFFAVTMPQMGEDEATRLAELAPPLAPALLEKWIGLFTERLFETVARPQIEELCAGGPKNDATLVLVYIMFMESARMEQQVAEDLSGPLAAGPDEGLAQALSAYFRAKLQSAGARAGQSVQ